MDFNVSEDIVSLESRALVRDTVSETPAQNIQK